MSATPPPKNSLLRSFLSLPPRQRIAISASLMGVSLAGIYLTNKVEQYLLEKQERDGTTDELSIDVIDPRHVETRGSSTDRVRLEERNRR